MYRLLIVTLLPLSVFGQIQHPVLNNDPMLEELRWDKRTYLQKDNFGKRSGSTAHRNVEYKDVTQWYNRKGATKKATEQIQRYDAEGRLIYYKESWQTTETTYTDHSKTTTVYSPKGKLRYTLTNEWDQQGKLLREDEEWWGKVISLRYLYDGQGVCNGYEKWYKGQMLARLEYLEANDSIRLARYTYQGKAYDVEYRYSKVKSSLKNYWQQKELLITTNEQEVWHIYQTQWDTLGLPLYKVYERAGKVVGTEQLEFMADGRQTEAYYDAKGRLLGKRELKSGDSCPNMVGTTAYEASYTDKDGKSVKQIEQTVNKECNQVVTTSVVSGHTYKTITYYDGERRLRSETYDNDRLITRTDYLILASHL